MVFDELPYGANWFDVVWVVALAYGVFMGIRTGLLGGIAPLLSWILVLGVALTYYVRVGDWIKISFGLDQEPARLTAYLLLVMCVFMISLILRRIIYKLIGRSTGTAFIQNFGGALAGFMRMTLVMIFITVWLSLTRSPFWHRYVSHESKLSSLVVEHLPSVAAVANTRFKEEFIFFRDIERVADTNEAEYEAIEPLTQTNRPAKSR